MAKTGQPRKTKQPFKIDRLPEAVREAIQYLRNSAGKTWEEIEELSSAPFNEKWKDVPGAGFIDWDTLPTDVLELFPDLKLSTSTLQRWWDVRIEQVRSQVLAESAKAREFAEKFVGKDLDDVNGAVLNALRDQIFGVMQTVSEGNRGTFISMLGDLTLAMSRLQRVDIQRRAVAVNERKVKAFEEREKLARQKLQEETAKLSKKAAKGQVTQEDVDRLFGRVFALPPRVQEARKVAEQ